MKVEITLTKDEKFKNLVTISSDDGSENKCWIILSDENCHSTASVSIEELKLALRKISLK